MRQFTEKQAIEFYQSNQWEELSHEAIAKLQITQDRLCVPFSRFHEAVEKTLGRPVFTHEFGLNREGLTKELFDGAEPPSLDEIINMIPEHKRLVIQA